MATSAEELTSCIVCFVPFRNPQLLLCQHTFCKSCVDKMANSGTIKCPKCNKVSMTTDVQPDFRLGVFLDALASTTQDLTGSTPTAGQGEQNQTAGKLCDLCEEMSVTHWCNDCDEWMCEHCKKAHSRSKTSRDHTLMSLSAKNDEYKATLRCLTRQIETKIEAYKNEARLFEARPAEIKSIQTKAIQDCNAVRAECRSQINKQFNDAKSEVEALIGRCLSAHAQILEQLNSSIQRLTVQKTQIEQLSLETDSDDVRVFDAKTTIDNAVDLLQTIAVPDVSIRLPNITVEPSAEWSDVKAVRLKISPGVDASCNSNRQVGTHSIGVAG